MADDKGKSGARDRATVSGSETYEVDYFARKHDLSREEAQALIDRVGNSRETLEAAVAAGTKAAPAKRGRPPKVSSGAAGSAPAERGSAATSTNRSNAKGPSASIAKTVSDVEAQVTAAVGAAAKPVAKVVPPVVEAVTATPRKIAKAATRGTTSVKAAPAATPKAVAKRASAAVDGVKSAATGRAASLVGAVAAGLVTGLAVNFGRKMVVQAPSALSGDWLDAIKVEHKLALALFDKLQATGSDDTGKRTVLLTQLKHALAKHAFTEENVIYPALRTWGDTVDADKLNHDHGYVKQNLYDLEGMDNASPAFLTKVESFRAELEEHIREEEDTIFPPLHAALGAAGNTKVTAQANKEGFKLA
ncbi:hemerythrin domain-containing protein [Sphingomonas sp. PAMC 26605]|uniref:hemerythrin domain-containing protein n=1 Tax=Sphingomonas sp. PAMC 26605 TaxID=1112214 RepID=UPI00026CB1E4|nr:hemerythrin domain-containing protein [Sphingomonas sp. PAMC 26605]